MENKTIYYFKEISNIPRESGNEKEIAKYIGDFAKRKNLDYVIDKYNNVIIRRYNENIESIILQAHLDMVCEKDKDKEFDFTKDAIEVIEKDGFLMANGTTLGADNGIGVAQILNLLDTTNYPIEAIFTSSEETTMQGAEMIDLSSLKGKTMINLDGFDEDTLLLESASFTDIYLHMNYEFKEKSNDLLKITLSGLEGGHSGFNIDKGRGNSSILLANLLLKLENVQIAIFIGGSKLNVIPSLSEVIIKKNNHIKEVLENFINKERNNYPNLDIKVELSKEERKLLTINDSKDFLNSISSFRHGVINKNKRYEVTTSENLGVVNLEKNILGVGLRSSIEEERLSVINYLNNYCNKYNYGLEIQGFQPGFRTMEDSSLVKDLIKVYQEFNDNKPLLKSVHIGVEVGLLKEKIKDLEVVIISPKIIDAHSPSERVDINSIKRCDEWLLRYLKNKYPTCK